MLQPGEVINGKYRIIRLIGDGGMGSVYEARHEVLGAHVALKFLHPEISKQAGLKQRFLQEARVSATVQSPHICRVSDVDTAAEGAYLVMDLLRGEPLQALIDRVPLLDVRQALDFTLQILAGLQVAHGKGVVHRDLKPDNVFLVPGPVGLNVVLLDFGIAKLRHTAEYQMTLTRPGAVMGTPEYMAPEQAYSADLVDQRSDLFSVGVMLFEMLGGKRPTDGDNPQQIAEKIITGNIEHLDRLRPELPPGLVQIVHRAIEGNPDKRWSSAEDLAQALYPFLGHAPAQPSSHHARSSTPFVPVNKTPIVSSSPPPRSKDAVATSSDLEYAETDVPPTVPPTNDTPPRSVLGKAYSTKTASMPAASVPPGSGAPRTLDYQRPLAAPVFVAKSSPLGRKKSTAWVWVSFLFLLLGAGAGGAIYYEREFTRTPRPPAPPTRRVTQQKAPTTFEVPDDLFDDDPKQRPVHVSRPDSPNPSRETEDAPRPKFPPIAFPTSLPPITLPTSFPTALPTAFPFPISPP